MKKKKVTVEIAESDYKAVQAMATACGWSINDVLAQCIKNGMPPSLEKIPSAFQEELLSLNQLDDMALLSVVEGTDDTKKHKEELYRKADFDVLRRTYALRLLQWRGHPVPNSYEAMIG